MELALIERNTSSLSPREKSFGLYVKYEVEATEEIQELSVSQNCAAEDGTTRIAKYGLFDVDVLTN